MLVQIACICNKANSHYILIYIEGTLHDSTEQMKIAITRRKRVNSFFAI